MFGEYMGFQGHFLMAPFIAVGTFELRFFAAFKSLVAVQATFILINLSTTAWVRLGTYRSAIVIEKFHRRRLV